MISHHPARLGVFVGICLLALAVAAPATVIHVPGEQPTIQEGINAATVGDTVLVAQGTYTGAGNRNISFNGTDCVLLAAAGAELTFIDLGGAARAFRIDGGESNALVIDGFTISGGSVDDDGGAIVCELASPTIRNCRFVDNHGDSGGALWLKSASPVVNDCSFTGNTAAGNSYLAGHGGAIWCGNLASPTITDCVFDANLGRRGGAVWCSAASSPTLIRCDFDGNTAHSMGGGMMSMGAGTAPLLVECNFTGNVTTTGGAYTGLESSPTFEDCFFIGNVGDSRGGACFFNESDALMTGCLFDGNSSLFGGAVISIDSELTLSQSTLHANAADFGSGLYVWSDSHPAHAGVDNTIIAFGAGGAAVHCEGDAVVDVGCTDIYGNAGGDWVGCIAGQLGINDNLSEDPLFCDAASGDLELQETSPCAPAQSPGNCELIGALPAGCGTSGLEIGAAPAVHTGLRAYPNPLRPGSGVIEWTSTGTAEHIVKVYDPLGRLLVSRQLGAVPAGTQHLSWDQVIAGHQLPAGVYFVRIQGAGLDHSPLRIVWTH